MEKILWNRAKSYTFWKYLKTNTIIILSLYAGLMTIFFLTKNKALQFNPLWLIVGWLLLLFYNILKTYFSIISITEDYRFHIKLNKNGVETEEGKKPWSSYLFYIEYDDYLEIHEKNEAISFLPKTEDLKEIIEYTMSNIKNKTFREKTLAEEIKEDFKNIEEFIQQHSLKETSAGNFPMGQYILYKNKELSLRYINERGFGIIEIGPARAMPESGV